MIHIYKDFIIQKWKNSNGLHYKEHRLKSKEDQGENIHSHTTNCIYCTHNTGYIMFLM